MSLDQVNSPAVLGPATYLSRVDVLPNGVTPHGALVLCAEEVLHGVSTSHPVNDTRNWLKVPR
jgi:hypothetical protein